MILSEDLFNLYNIDPDETFIWVYTVCKSTHLGVSHIPRVNPFLAERLFHLVYIQLNLDDSLYILEVTGENFQSTSLFLSLRIELTFKAG